MDLNSYIEKYNVKEKTVLKWLQNGFIPGAIIQNNEWIIPENARKPFKCSKKILKPETMYKSFVKAYFNGENIVPQMYNITKEKFDLINNHLLEQGLIVVENLDGLIYYNATKKGIDYISFKGGKLYNLFLELFGLAIYKSTMALIDACKGN